MLNFIEVESLVEADEHFCLLICRLFLNWIFIWICCLVADINNSIIDQLHLRKRNLTIKIIM